MLQESAYSLLSVEQLIHNVLQLWKGLIIHSALYLVRCPCYRLPLEHEKMLRSNGHELHTRPFLLSRYFITLPQVSLQANPELFLNGAATLLVGFLCPPSVLIEMQEHMVLLFRKSGSASHLQTVRIPMYLKDNLQTSSTFIPLIMTRLLLTYFLAARQAANRLIPQNIK